MHSPAGSDPSPPPAVGGDARFPLRVAAVDVGTNAIRFVAAEFSTRSDWAELESIRVPIRLGREAFRTGRLPADAMDEALTTFQAFRRRVEELGIRAVRAVATSAVRESANGAELVERARHQAGLRLEPISGAEEARLVWRAMRERLPLPGAWVLVDLGGGSLEVSLVEEQQIRASESHPLGTVRLLEELGARGEETTARLHQMMRPYLRGLRLPGSAHEQRLAGMVAVGGNIEALAELAGARPDARGVSRLPLWELREAMERVAELSLRERVETLGLGTDRADVIVPAGVVYERVARLCGAAEIVIPGVGVKEGVLLELAEGALRGAACEPRR